MLRIALAALVLASAPPARAADAGSPPSPPAKAEKKKAPPLKAMEPKKSKLVLPAFFGVFGPSSLLAKTGFRSSPGRWIEYRLSGAGTATLRIQEVGPAPAGTRWIEFFTSGGSIGEGGLRLLTRGDKDGNIERVVVMTPMLPAMELPLDKVELGKTDESGEPSPAPFPTLPTDIPVQVVGKEKITVPLGTFETTHYKVESEEGAYEYWISSDPKIPFAGAVRFSQGGNMADAVKVGNDATARIAVPPKVQ